MKILQSIIIIPGTVINEPLPMSELGGMTTVNGSPASKRILVLDRDSGIAIAIVHSHSVTGKWKLTGIQTRAEGSLLVIALDDTGKFNAEVADHVSQALPQ